MIAKEAYEFSFPDYFDGYAAAIEAKGYFADLVVKVGDVLYKPVFYDGVRLRQEYESHFADGFTAFSERSLVIIPAVTRQHITDAIHELARAGFRTLVPEHTAPSRSLDG